MHKITQILWSFVFLTLWFLLLISVPSLSIFQDIKLDAKRNSCCRKNPPTADGRNKYWSRTWLRKTNYCPTFWQQNTKTELMTTFPADHSTTWQNVKIDISTLQSECSLSHMKQDMFLWKEVTDKYTSTTG